METPALFNHAEAAAAMRHFGNRWVRISAIQDEFTPEERKAAEAAWSSYEDEYDEILHCLAIKSSPALVQQIIAILRQDADYHQQQAVAAGGQTIESRVERLEAQLDMIHGATSRPDEPVISCPAEPAFVVGPEPTACNGASRRESGAADR